MLLYHHRQRESMLLQHRRNMAQLQGVTVVQHKTEKEEECENGEEGGLPEEATLASQEQWGTGDLETNTPRLAMHGAHNTVILGPMIGWPLPGSVRRVSPRAMV